VVEVRPEFYGMLLFYLAGQGSLLNTQLSATQVNASAYTVKRSDGGLSLVIVNKESAQNLQLSIDLPQTAKTAQVITMTQFSPGAAGPSLSATAGVTIQGATIDANGAFA